MKLNKYMSVCFLLLCLLISYGQTRLYSRVSPSGNSIQLKWYAKELVNRTGFDLYRKAVNGEWEKISSEILQLNPSKVRQMEACDDPFLQAAATLCVEKNLESLSLLIVALASFQSQLFSEAIGIYYEDTTVVAGQIYQYQLQRRENVLTQPEAISPIIRAGDYRPEICPQKLRSSVHGNKISFSWQEESKRYYGVKVYRRQADSATNKCLTEQPIFFTGTTADSTRVTERFRDHVPKSGGQFYYTFYGVDFFGSLTEVSPALILNFPDLEGPPAPKDFLHLCKGKKVDLSWTAVKNCQDLLAYEVYRTNRNDTDYVKITSLKSDTGTLKFTDLVPEFQSYFYSLVSVDQSGNRSLAQRIQVDVPDLQAPRPPADIKIRSDSGMILLEWDKNPEKDLSGYLLYRSINDTASGNFVKITPDVLIENHFKDVLPAHAKNNFHYKLVAVDKDLNRSSSSKIVACRLPDRSPPSPPFMVSALQSEKGISINWWRNPENDLHHYILHVYTNDTTRSDIQIAQKVTDEKFEHLNPIPGKTYCYRLTAHDSSGNVSASSNTLSVCINRAEKIENTALTVSLKYEKKTRLFQFTWKKKNLGDTVQFVVYRRSPDESVFYPVTGAISTTSYSEQAPTLTHPYYYQVRAYLPDGLVIKSNILKTKTHEKEKADVE